MWLRGGLDAGSAMIGPILAPAKRGPSQVTEIAPWSRLRLSQRLSYSNRRAHGSADAPFGLRQSMKSLARRICDSTARWIDYRGVIFSQDASPPRVTAGRAVMEGPSGRGCCHACDHS